MTQRLTIPISDTEWLTANGRYHWADKAKRTKTLRSKTAILARKLEPYTKPVHVTAFIAYPRGGRVDVHNAMPSVKPCIDGLVDAGVLVDDSTTYLLGPDLRVDRPTKTKGLHEIRLIITSQHVDF